MSEQREALAEALGAHEQVVGGCSCGWRVARRSVEAWRAHVAAALIASDALARLLAEARAEALREFAGKWADWIAKGAPQARVGAAYRAICEAQLLEAEVRTSPGDAR